MITSTQFLKSPFIYTGDDFHNLKSFKNEKGIVTPERAVILRKLPGEFSVLNTKTGETWHIRELTAKYTPRVKGVDQVPQPCFIIYRPEYGKIMILLKDCFLWEGANG